MGPQPKTATVSPGCTSAWFTACMLTPVGSASAATSSGMRSGTGNRRLPLAASRTRSSGVRPPSSGSAAQPSELLVDRVDDDPVADGGAGHLVADPLDHPGQLVAEGHGPPGETAHVDEGHVGAADPAGGHPHQGVPGARVGLGDVVEADVVGPVHADLLHRPPPLPPSPTRTGGSSQLVSVTGADPGTTVHGTRAGKRSGGKRRPTSLTGRAASRVRTPRRASAAIRPGSGGMKGGTLPSDRCVCLQCAASRLEPVRRQL